MFAQQQQMEEHEPDRHERRGLVEQQRPAQRQHRPHQPGPPARAQPHHMGVDAGQGQRDGRDPLNRRREPHHARELDQRQPERQRQRERPPALAEQRRQEPLLQHDRGGQEREHERQSDVPVQRRDALQGVGEEPHPGREVGADRRRGQVVQAQPLGLALEEDHDVVAEEERPRRDGVVEHDHDHHDDGQQHDGDATIGRPRRLRGRAGLRDRGHRAEPNAGRREQLGSRGLPFPCAPLTTQRPATGRRRHCTSWSSPTATGPIRREAEPGPTSSVRSRAGLPGGTG